MNVLFFGPNGSGKGTQGAILKDKYNIPHIESGAIFRDNIQNGTALGSKAKAYIDRGDLVPDEITIPMILDRLQADDCKSGWLLDGFPRTTPQAEALDSELTAMSTPLTDALSVDVPMDDLMKRLTGRRTCKSCQQMYNAHFSAKKNSTDKREEKKKQPLTYRPA